MRSTDLGRLGDRTQEQQAIWVLFVDDLFFAVALKQTQRASHLPEAGNWTRTPILVAPLHACGSRGIAEKYMDPNRWTERFFIPLKASADIRCDGVANPAASN